MWAVVRVEQISVADASAEDGIEVDLTDSIYLGDRWEYRLARGGLRAKAHGPRPLPAGKVWARIPPESVWLFEAAA
ncbi:MAG TPA: TOBE domain-containing protein [Geminicoccaceae bacterium]|nr:TOBE domain-containing protein [Geminicoccaceae bacterium]